MTASGRVPAPLYRWRRLVRARSVSIDGIRLIAYRADIPKHVSSLIVRGDYELPERQAVARVLAPGDRVLEIGACIGLVALQAARIVGARNVLCYEPNPAAAKVAAENFAANDLPVEIRAAAVGAVSGEMMLQVAAGSWLGASAARSFADGTSLRVTTVGIAEAVAAFRPSVIIIDAEGMEKDIVPSCPLDGVRAVIVELHSDLLSDADVAMIERHLRGAGLYPCGEASSANVTVWLRA